MEAWTITFPMGRLCPEPVEGHVWDECALSLSKRAVLRRVP
jgi:hypothetical protein